MKKSCQLALIAVFLVPAAVSQAIDAVKTATSPAPISGKIAKVTAQNVTIEARGTEKVIPVNEIIGIVFEGEPTALKGVRTGVAAKSYEDVLTALEKLQVDSDTRKEIMQDVAFYKVVCVARLALAGKGETMAAAKAVNGFLNSQSDSYHYYEACELMGDLAVSIKRYSSAASFYGKLLATPWPNYKMRGGLSMGRAYLAEHKPAEALKAFEEAAAVEGKGAGADQLHALALAGKARCLAETGKPDEAVKIAQGLIDKFDSDETEIHANAYVAMGTAYRALNKPREALLAFLHVDLLYNTAADAHAEALANLVNVWNDLKQPERADRARDALNDQYKNSPWAQTQQP